MAFLGPEQRKLLRSGNRVVAVGSELGIATLIGLFGGSWIDEHLGSRPWFTFFGVALGLAAGVKSLLRLGATQQRPRGSTETTKPDESPGKKPGTEP